MKLSYIVLFICTSHFYFTLCNAQSYTWRNMPIGGTGYVTGLVIHPMDSSVQYARTDVGGAYRWSSKDGKWVSISDMFTYDERNLYHVESIAVDPKNVDIIYFYAGQNGNFYDGIYKSIDRGNKWIRLCYIKGLGNSDKRWIGESLQIDPNNTSVIYCGTRRNGLIRSVDGGTSWTSIPSVPVGNKIITTSDIGIRSVAIDGRSALVNGHSSKIYVAVYGTGIYRSTDGGITFSLLSGSPVKVNQIKVGADKTLYVTAQNGVFKFNNEWTVISPILGERFNALDVLGSHIAVVVERGSDNFSSNLNLPIFYSTNGGKTWSTNIISQSTVEWLAPYYDKKNFSGATASIRFNSADPKVVYLSDWYAIYRTSNITTSAPLWQQQKGHEETVCVGMASPPHPLKGQPELFTAVADFCFFRHTSSATYPTHYKLSAEGADIDFCESNPNYVVLIGNPSKSIPSSSKIAISSDRGATWTRVNNSNIGTFGNIAYSATNTSLLVASLLDGAPVYSKDRGVTWKRSTGATIRIASNTIGKSKRLVADKVNGNTFYYYNDNQFFRSNDGGVNWVLMSNISGTSVRIKSVFGHKGHIWLGSSTALYKSTNGGGLWTQIADFSSVRSIGVGKAYSTYPTIYVYGKYKNEWGVYQNVDAGNAWKKITKAEQVLGDDPGLLEGDRETFGKVYIGTDGRGVFYSDNRIIVKNNIKSFSPIFTLKNP